MSNEAQTAEAQGAALAAQEATNAAKTLEVAKAYVIDSPEMAEAAADDLVDIKGRLKKLSDQRMSITRPLDEAKSRIMDLFRGPQAVLEKAEQTLKSALLTWQQEERRKAEEQRRQQEEAARKAREEEQRKAAEAEAARIAAEEEARKAAEAGDAEALAAAEEKVVEAEQTAAVATEIAEVLQHAAPVAVAGPAKLSGISVREEWKCECTDLMTLVKAIVEGKASIELIAFDQVEANRRAKALKKEFSAPGVRAYSVDSMAARAAR